MTDKDLFGEEISEEREIFSYYARFMRENVKRKGINECWEWQRSLVRGYGAMHYRKKDQSRDRVSAHRFAYLFYYDEWPKVVMHTCDNPKCCNPMHLKGGTHKENSIDMVQKGRQNKQILNEDLVRFIRCYHGPRGWQRIIADKLGVHFSAISKVRKGVTWKHVK